MKKWRQQVGLMDCCLCLIPGRRGVCKPGEMHLTIYGMLGLISERCVCVGGGGGGGGRGEDVEVRSAESSLYEAILLSATHSINVPFRTDCPHTLPSKGRLICPSLARFIRKALYITACKRCVNWSTRLLYYMLDLLSHLSRFTGPSLVF